MTFTTYSSKQLGGMVVEQITALGTNRAVIRSNGKNTVAFKSHHEGADWRVYGGKSASADALKMFEAAKAALIAA